MKYFILFIVFFVGSSSLFGSNYQYNNQYKYQNSKKYKTYNRYKRSYAKPRYRVNTRYRQTRSKYPNYNRQARNTNYSYNSRQYSNNNSRNYNNRNNNRNSYNRYNDNNNYNEVKKPNIPIVKLATKKVQKKDTRKNTFSFIEKAGTTGMLFEIKKSLIPETLHIRLGKSNYDHSATDLDYDEFKWDVDVKLDTAHLLFDYELFLGLNFSFGVVSNKNAFALDMKFPDQTVEFGGATYNVTDIGSVSSTMVYDKSVVPYVGLNWMGTLFWGLGLTLDAGVIASGSPTLAMNVTCGSSLDAQSCLDLKADVAKEEADAQRTLDNDVEYYPVVTFGLTQTFSW